jgi:hypothetical protein
MYNAQVLIIHCCGKCNKFSTHPEEVYYNPKLISVFLPLFSSEIWEQNVYCFYTLTLNITL